MELPVNTKNATEKYCNKSRINISSHFTTPSILIATQVCRYVAMFSCQKVVSNLGLTSGRYLQTAVKIRTLNYTMIFHESYTCSLI